MTRKSLREIQDYAGRRGWHIAITRRIVERRKNNLSWANLTGADLSGAIINWQSHNLIAEILRQSAGDNVQRRMVAGLVLVSHDWCWGEFLALDIPEREWALETLAAYVKDDGAPEALRRMEGREAGE